MRSSPFSDHRPFLISLATLVVGLLPACSPEQPDATYVARVDRTELSEQDLQRTLHYASGDPRRRRDYVNEWVLTEMLYQEAVKKGKADTDEARRQMEIVRKRLAIAALLEEAVYAGVDTTDISDQSVASYLQRSGDEFLLRADVARISLAIFSTRDAASAFRGLLLSGTSWDDAVSLTRSDTSAAPRLERVETPRYHTRSSLYPEDLWKLAVTLNPNEPSFPARISGGYAVVLSHGVKRQGDAPEFDYVRDEVRSRMLIDLRRRRYEQYVRELRSRYTVDIRDDASDTTRGDQ